MREAAAALAHFGASAFERFLSSFTGCASGAFAGNFAGYDFGFVNFDPFDVAENHRLDVAILVFVEHRRDGWLIVDFFLLVVAVRVAFQGRLFRLLFGC
jgi:hypothetical protein